MCYMFTMEFFSAIKHEVVLFSWSWMQFVGIILSKASNSQKDNNIYFLLFIVPRFHIVKWDHICIHTIKVEMKLFRGKKRSIGKRKRYGGNVFNVKYIPVWCLNFKKIKGIENNNKWRPRREVALVHQLIKDTRSHYFGLLFFFFSLSPVIKNIGKCSPVDFLVFWLLQSFSPFVYQVPWVTDAGVLM